MKQLLRVFAFAGAAFAWGAVDAQPTLTASGCNPQIGDAFTNYTGNYVSPGSGGANQTWDFSALAGSSGAATTCVSPTSTSQGSSFPNATVVTPAASGDRYFECNSSVFTSWGVYVSPSGTTISHTDPEDFLRYPMSMGGSFIDPFGGPYVNGGYTYYRSGTVTVTADGYGTLITPGGTYTDVTRVHFVEDYEDSVNFGFPIINTTYNDEYFWYKDGYHYPIATTFQLSVNGSLLTSSASYTDFGAVGVQDGLSDARLSVFPNPASESAEATFWSDASRPTNLEVLDASGRSVLLLEGIESHAGPNKVKLDVSELPSGLYLLNAGTNEHLNATVRLVVTH